MVKILTIGTYLENTYVDKYNQISNSSSQISIAAVKYSRFIERGVYHNVGRENSENLFIPPIGSYPSCKVVFWNKRKIADINYAVFVNILLIKQLTIAVSVFFYVLKWCLKNKNSKKYIILTFIYPPFQLALPFLKLIFGFKVVSFVPDMVEYEFNYQKDEISLKKLLVPLYRKITNCLHNVTDIFVFITEHMIEKYPKKPYLIIEGFVDNLHEEESMISKKNAIMYSGALYEKFGIETLIKAFMKLKGSYELWLFGSGDFVKKINHYEKIDNRIKFFGQVNNIEVMKHQRMAKLLVNPRPTTEEFTKYSFPSKLLEYLYSGTPVLTTKLAGIPKEYDNYFYYFEVETVEGMSTTLNEILGLDDSQLYSRGKLGKKFVASNKEFTILIKNMLNFIYNI
ncbi:glycosyltransferase [Sphingobacterium luzhongxinii]|uniref:glycosyltransferase n=1 Tax=Sphingobacterium luzhongxinii TaxID=2654181 RepID=UPI0013DC0948|nr:glycosyltransferase [Sphingobacterium sp. xlx-73]